MKKSHLVAVLATCAAGLAWMSLARSPALAQQRPPMAMPAAPIALIDISLIFKAHPTFKAQMNQINEDMGRAEADIKRENQQIQSFGESLKDWTPGSPEYKRTEEEYIRRKTALQMRIHSQQQEFMLRQAQVYNQVYQEILQEVDYFCRSNNIAMVLNFNSEKVDVRKPDDVARMVYRPIVYWDGRMDITPRIIENLAQRRPPASSGGNGPMPSANSQGVGGPVGYQR